MKSKILVISDLHIGSGRLDDCDGELERCLIEFLLECSSEDGPVELVINGDFLDFVQAEPWEGTDFETEYEGVPLCFTQEQSAQKFKSIVAAHGLIFKALGNFLSIHAENSLVVLPGNHDADFFWPEVRRLFQEAVGEERADLKGRIHFKLEQCYRPEARPEVWIEHGHQYDPNNRFFIETDEIDPVVGTKVEKPVWSEERPPIFKDRAGRERLYQCIGTRFLIQFMNRLDSEYPFVDNVKPFSRFLRIFGASTFNPRYKLLTPAANVWRMLRYLVKEGVNSPGSLLSLDQPAAGFGPSALLKAMVDAMTEAELVWFVGELEARGFSFKNKHPKMFLDSDPSNAESLMTFLSENPDVVQRLEEVKIPLLGFAPGTLSMGQAFFVDETEKLREAAQKVLNKEGVAYAVMGHTHEPVEGQRYINTGCWTRYYRFGGDENMRSWDVLKENSYELFPYELRYAEIAPGQPPRAIVFRERKS
ncbi:MAG TPA: metallophosphoesterase [Pyrinomonadaceae bacterium]|nr:metallophosphoesterase [Pyrinomonadaceae bacterium]